jgi:replication factor A2
VAAQSTRIKYTLDDGTGTIDVIKWLTEYGDQYENGSVAPLPQDAWVKVWGRMKALNGVRQVSAIVVRPLQDHNEISVHLLECTLVHLQMTRGLPGKGGAQNARAGADGMDIDGGMGNGMGGGRDFSGLSANAKKIFQFIEGAKQSHEGVHMQNIAQDLHMEINQVAKGGNELTDKGLIYSTVDEDTWAVLDM